MPTTKKRGRPAKTAAKSELEQMREALAAATARLEALETNGNGGKGHKSADRPGASAGTKVTVTEAQVKAMDVDEFDALRYGLVQKDEDGELVLEREGGKKQYALIKGVKREWYMACKGFATTLKARGALSEEPNDKGRSQLLYAQEILSAMQAAGIINLRKKGAKSA